MSVNHWQSCSWELLPSLSLSRIFWWLQVFFPDVVNTCTDDGRRAGRACGGTCCYFTRDEWDSHHFSLGCWKSRKIKRKKNSLSLENVRVLSPCLSCWAMIYRLSCWKGRIWKIASLDWQMPSDSSCLSLLAMLAFLSLSSAILLDYCIFIDESPQQSTGFFRLKRNCCTLIRKRRNKTKSNFFIFVFPTAVEEEILFGFCVL